MWDWLGWVVVVCLITLAVTATVLVHVSLARAAWRMLQRFGTHRNEYGRWED